MTERIYFIIRNLKEIIKSFINLICFAGGHPEDEEVTGVTDHDKDIDAITGHAGC